MAKRNNTTLRFLGGAVFFFAVFFLPAIAKADEPPNPLISTGTCPPSESGKTYAVFGKTTSSAYPPSALTESCVPVSKGATEINATALSSHGVVSFDLYNTSANKQIWSCTPEEGALEVGFLDIGSSRTNLVSAGFEMSFELKQVKRDEICGSTREDLPIRYAFDSPEGAFYLYFLGFSDKSTNEILPCSAYAVSDKCNLTPNCFWQETDGSTPARDVKVCQNKLDRSVCPSLPRTICGAPTSPACAWNETTGRCLTALEQNIVNQNQAKYDSDSSAFQTAIPPCAYEGTCNQINDVLSVTVRYARGSFVFLGIFALAFFMFGGFEILISRGNSEKVERGKNIIAAAVIGLIVCFGAYAGVSFIMQALDVSPEYKVIGN